MKTYTRAQISKAIDDALAAGNLELAWRIFDLAARHAVKVNEYRELVRQRERLRRRAVDDDRRIVNASKGFGSFLAISCCLTNPKGSRHKRLFLSHGT